MGTNSVAAMVGGGLLISMAWACNSDGDTSEIETREQLGQLGRYCSTTSPCANGLECRTDEHASGVCTKPCSADGDCSAAGYVCGVSAQGQQECVPQCERGANYVCVGDVSTHCAAADDTHCETCGCPATLRCDPGVGCVGKSELGGPCAKDSDCNTDHCSNVFGTCRVPVGSSCSAEDCDLCYHDEDQSAWSYCSRDCSSDGQCNGGKCIGYSGDYWCHPPCDGLGDASCHGECDYTSDYSTLFCDIEGSVTTPERSVGTVCEANSQCTSELCIHVVLCDSFTCHSAGGYCSQPCETAADCTGGTTCVAIPCTGDSDSECGSLCALPCDETAPCPGRLNCRALTTVPEGDAIAVCDGHLEADEPCSGGPGCVSGQCTDSVCAPIGGMPNGASCASPTDCASGSCINGGCRGSALIGGTCTVPADCAAGTCCAGVCASAC